MWKTRLLGYVNIRCGIFQGDSLSSLLFVMSLFPLSSTLQDLNKVFIVDGIVVSHLLYLDDLKLYSKSEHDTSTLVNTIRIFSDDIRMSFGLSKCVAISVKRCRVTDCADMELPEGTIEALPILSAYKYLGILEAGEFQHTEIKSSYYYLYKPRL